MSTPSYCTNRHLGVVSLELAVSFISLVTLSLFMIDAVQLLRARYTTSEAAHVMADHISGLGTTSDLSGSPVLQESEATQAAQTELTAIFPGTKFTCGTIHNDNCARIQLSYPNTS